MPEKFKQPDGIVGLEGREPVGAVVSVGIKAGGGFPTQTDRFHIVQPYENNGIREAHPAFSAFNAAPADARKVIRGNLMHAKIEDCFNYSLRAQVIQPLGAHPNKMPCCVGDGKTARRWDGGDADNFRDIECPNERCQYRLTTPPACKPFARLLFQLRWKDGSPLPCPLVKYTTGSWNTVANLKGFFKYIENGAKQCGAVEPNFFGFPFMLTLTRKTQASQQRGFPVVSITPEISPNEFFSVQGLNALPVNTVQTLEDMSSADDIAADYRSINVPSK